MSINLIGQKEHELILKAQSSRCQTELKELSRNPFSNVRRCVAKNSLTPKHILDELLFDPVANVSYIASLKTSDNQIKKEFNISNRCISCTKDESTFIYECGRCME